MDRLWYRRPAALWEEALPIGNGSIGGMVYSGIGSDRISLNKDTLWSGKPIDQKKESGYRKSGRSKLLDIRSSLLKEDYKTSRNLIEDFILGDWGESYLPLGDLLLETKQVKEEAAESYERELNLEEGLVKMKYASGDNRISREYLCSYPAGGLLIHTVSKEPMNAVVSFECPLMHTSETEEGQLLIEGRCPEHVEPDYMGEVDQAVVYGEKGIRFQIRISVCCSGGGSLKSEQGKMILEGVKEYTVFVAIKDSFLRYDKEPAGEYLDACRQQMIQLRSLDYMQHRAIHLEDYVPLFHASDFDLTYKNKLEYEQLTTDERLFRFPHAGEDLGLFVMLVKYAKYLLIAASREGSQPTNLQGIWNKNVRAVWSSNYTVNINTQMNYWPVLPLNLSGLQEPLNRMLTELSEAGAITAKELYGCRGWVSHHNIDLWRKTTPAGGPWKRRGFSAVRHSMWPMSGVWLSRHLIEQYEYCLDREFLKETAYPIIRGSALFLLDWLVAMPDGSLQTVPSTSPENEFLIEKEAYGISVSSSMDLFLCRELFSNCLKAIQLLGVDAELELQLKQALERLPWPQTGKDGRLLEWSKELEEAEVNHRHVSHLYGLYPGDIMPEQNYPACEKSLEIRGDEGTGWSYAWKACLWARLGNGERANRLFHRMLTPVDAKEVDYRNGGIYPNLFMAHPPFQIDANFGVAAGILETVVQSVKGCVVLLPALPREWPEGSVRSVALKNGLLLDMDWSGGQIEKVVITKIKEGGSKKNCIAYHQKLCEIDLEAGEKRELSADDFI